MTQSNQMTELWIFVPCPNRVEPLKSVSRPGDFCQFRAHGTYIFFYEIGRPANTLAQWCTSWYHQIRICVQNTDVNPRDIMCLLDSVVLGVQAPREEPLDEAATATRSFFGGSRS